MEKSKNICCSQELMSDLNNWTVESIVNIDDKGQMVIPKEVRQKAGLRAGEKLALVTCRSKEEVCCILLLKSDKLIGTITEMSRIKSK